VVRPVSFQLRTIDRTPLYVAIVEQILAGIESGAFPPGSALPAERILAARLGVSRSSVREAIRVLEHTGIVDVRTGSGTYVVDGPGSAVAVLRTRAALSGEHSPLDVIAARNALEPAAAAIAAAQRHESDLELLEAILAQHAAQARAGEDTAAVDLEFHLAVAGATRNPVLLLLLERLVEIMRRRPWSELKHRTRAEPGSAAQDVREHRAVLSAIARGDGGRAARAMAKHLSSVERDLLAEIEH
jgi:GntR family transcriptional repressor for pyruvate dehydrogenase complex